MPTVMEMSALIGSVASLLTAIGALMKIREKSKKVLSQSSDDDVG